MKSIIWFLTFILLIPIIYGIVILFQAWQISVTFNDEIKKFDEQCTRQGMIVKQEKHILKCVHSKNREL